MKTILKLLLILLLTSCASTKIIELGGKTANKGTEVSQKAIDVYNMISAQADIDKSQQDRLKIMTHPNPAEMERLPDTKVQTFKDQIKLRVTAYQSLLKTYKAFNLLTDSKYGDKTQEATASLQKSYNAIEKLPDIPSSVSSKLPEVAKMITRGIQSKKIKEHNEVLAALTELYIQLWEEDSKIWYDYLDRVYIDYATGLNTVPNNRFDSKRIAQNSNEPFSNETILILLYRLKYRDDIIKKNEELKQQLINFGKALRELNKIHVEISKTKTDIADVTGMINSIEDLLK